MRLKAEAEAYGERQAADAQEYYSSKVAKSARAPLLAYPSVLRLRQSRLFSGS